MSTYLLWQGRRYCGFHAAVIVRFTRWRVNASYNAGWSARTRSAMHNKDASEARAPPTAEQGPSFFSFLFFFLCLRRVAYLQTTLLNWTNHTERVLSYKVESGMRLMTRETITGYSLLVTALMKARSRRDDGAGLALKDSLRITLNPNHTNSRFPLISHESDFV